MIACEISNALKSIYRVTYSYYILEMLNFLHLFKDLWGQIKNQNISHEHDIDNCKNLACVMAVLTTLSKSRF